MVADGVRKAVDTANSRFVEGFVKRDASITASGFAEDAVVFPPDAAMIQGKEAIEEFWGTVMASGVREVQLTTVELVESGGYVHERGTGILKTRPAGEVPSEQKIKYVVVWRRTGEDLENLWDICNNAP
jgi:ketosteroid isomerase-like protein